jgi:hypothetical protein
MLGPAPLWEGAAGCQVGPPPLWEGAAGYKVGPAPLWEGAEPQNQGSRRSGKDRGPEEGVELLWSRGS